MKTYSDDTTQSKESFVWFQFKKLLNFGSTKTKAFRLLLDFF